MIDPAASYGDTRSVLINSESVKTELAARPKGPARYRTWIFLSLLVSSLIWLNGPGLRLLAPRIASHFLAKSGLHGNFKVEGSLTGGISISELQFESDREIASLSINRINPTYRLARLFRGQLENLEIDGIHLNLRLGLPPYPQATPFDFSKLNDSLLAVRNRLLPLGFKLKNFSLTATRDRKPVLQLAPSQINHSPDSREFFIKLATITDATGHHWPAQQSVIQWNPENLSIPHLDPLPGLSLRELVISLPLGAQPSLETELHLDDAVLFVAIAPGFSSARIDLREGKLQIQAMAKRFGVEIPAATLTSLAVELDQILPNPRLATGSVRLLLENLAWQNWNSPALSMDATLNHDHATLTTHAQILGTELSLDAKAPLKRTENNLTLGETVGHFNLTDVPLALHQLAKHFPTIDPKAALPPAKMAGNFTVLFAENVPQSASADFELKPHDPKIASPISIKSRWNRQQSISAELAIDGLTATATYQPSSATYQASLDLTEFMSRKIEPWLSVIQVKPSGSATLTAKWHGSGQLKTTHHQGELTLTQATWSRETMPDLTASGGLNYTWPSHFETTDLRLQMNDQTVALEAALNHHFLELRHFLWSHNGTPLIEGTASLPAPTDFHHWRDALAEELRPLSVSISSRPLSLELLKPWLPALANLDPRSSGQLELQVSGTYSEPVIAAKVEAKNLRSPAQAKLPPANLRLRLASRAGRLVLDGSATAQDLPATLIQASMPFRPANWLQTPAQLLDETLEARVDLPRFDLSRFSSLVPNADQLRGLITGNFVATGKIRKPELKGKLELDGGELRFHNDHYPTLEGVTAKIDLSLDQIVLKTLKTRVAGGTLQGEGTLAITAGKLGELNFRLRGNHLPIIRNDFLILRANADLRLQGPWQRALLTGTLGAVDSIFYRDIELLPIGTPFTTPSAAALPKLDPPTNQTDKLPEPFRNWPLNLQVRTEEPVLIRGNFATGEVTGNLRIAGTLAAPSPNGTFKIKDFRAALPFSTLSVPSGTATFTPATGFDPLLEIRGTAEPRPYRVTLYAYGRASNPQLILTSNPPLPENEIMTLLATGTTTTGLVNPQAASSRALQLLAEELRRGRFRYGKQLRPLLGLLDRVDFNLAEADPYSSESYSTATLSITDRWFLSAGVGATGDNRVLAIWRLSFR